MSYSGLPKDAAGLQRLMEKRFSGFSLRFKSDGYAGLAIHYRVAVCFVKALYAVMGFLSRGRFHRDFDKHYVTVFGNEVWLPSRRYVEDPNFEGVLYGILRHEMAHMLDREAHPVWFPLSYVLFFPTLYTMRAEWEWRGYTQTMMVDFERYGEISDEQINRIAKIMTSGGYFFMMAPWRGAAAQARAIQIAVDITSGRLVGYDLHKRKS